MIVSGDAQSATVGTELSAPVVVRVTDDAGNPVPGQLINFRVVSGGGSTFAGSSITNDAGEARERWTLGKVAAENQALEARAVDPTTGDPIVFATFHATALPDAAFGLKKASADSGQGFAGEAVTLSPAVKVVDRFDNPVAGTEVVFAVASGGGTVNGERQVSNAQGVATVGSWTLGPTPSANTLTATVAGLSGSPITFLTYAVTGPVAMVAVSPTSVSLLALHQQLTAEMKDASGNVVTGAAVSWSSANTSVATVDGDGLVTAVAEGTTSITATSNGKSANATITVLPWTFSSIAPDDAHACGLLTNGKAYCWGYNGFGELGDGTTTDRLAPVAVQETGSFAALSTGLYLTCGLADNQSIYCWGNNASGQVGDGTTTLRLTPTPVQGSIAFQAVAVGGSTVCGLSTAGAAYCWGSDFAGGLGDGKSGPFVFSTTPVAVLGGLTFTAIATSAHSCGLTQGGAVYCWGDNSRGQLGDGTTTNRLTPTAVQGGHVFKSITVFGGRTCGLDTDGLAYCWGSNEGGAIGDGTTQDRLLPTAVSGGLSFTSIGVGARHTCGLANAGRAYCWGYNDYGDLGDGTTTPRLSPTPVHGEFVFSSLQVGENLTCGVTTTGLAYCWGFNRYGGVGDGTTDDRLTPTAVRRP